LKNSEVGSLTTSELKKNKSKDKNKQAQTKLKEKTNLNNQNSIKRFDNEDVEKTKNYIHFKKFTDNTYDL